MGSAVNSFPRMWSMPCSIVTIFRDCATSLPDFSSIEYQPVRSRPFSRDVHPFLLVADDGSDPAAAWIRAQPCMRQAPATMGKLALNRFRRFIMRVGIPLAFLTDDRVALPCNSSEKLHALPGAVLRGLPFVSERVGSVSFFPHPQKSRSHIVECGMGLCDVGP
jgi:hypothetical protein